MENKYLILLGMQMIEYNNNLLHFDNFKTNSVNDNIINKLLDSGGIIYGGYLRDIISNKNHSDIDVYFPYYSIFGKFITEHYYDLHSYDSIRFFYEGIMHNIGMFSWGKGIHTKQNKTIYKNKLFVEKYSAIKLPVYNSLNKIEYVNIISPISSQDMVPTADFNFLDFDINTLYLEKDRILKSTINDTVDVINNIKNKKCKIMRSDVDKDRIIHILNKGYVCPRLALAE